MPPSNRKAIEKSIEAFRITLPEYQRRQEFYFFSRGWDVVKGLWLASQHGSPTDMEVATFAGNYGLNRKPTWEKMADGGERMVGGSSLLIRTNEKWCHDNWETADYTVPILVGTIITPDGEIGNMILDGWHRLHMAVAYAEMTHLPAHILSVVETDWIVLR